MARISTTKTIAKSKGKVNPRYDMQYFDYLNIKNANDERLFDCMCDSFLFGYAQGLKVAKVETKKSLR